MRLSATPTSKLSFVPMADNKTGTEYDPRSVTKSAKPDRVVVRKEIRKMPREEQLRFVNVCKYMMKNKSGPQTSKWFEMSAHHGWPNNYCTHGQENFPSWHRAYLACFEQELRKADMEMGNDGNISLPYWDYTDVDGDEVFPKILRDELPDMPEDLVTEGRFARIGFKKIRDDSAIRSRIKQSGAILKSEQCLDSAEHWKFASTRWKMGVSVEAPHNDVHVAVGYPMSQVNYAAYHPIFYLHHCNIDRIMSKYLARHPDSDAEYAHSQRYLSEHKETNRYDQWLEPFHNPWSGEKMYAKETMGDTAEIGYVYDELPPDPRQQMRAMPNLVVFKGIEVFNLHQKSYTCHVFVTAKGAPFAWPDGLPDDWEQLNHYAGGVSIFGGKGAACVNCLERKPLTMTLEINEALDRLGFRSRHEIDVHVLAEDENGVVSGLEQTIIPPPILGGPMWDEGADESIQVKVAQKMIAQLGFKGPNNEDVADDGVLGPITLNAIKSMQAASGELVADGVVGPLTREVLMRPRLDKKSSHEGGPSAPTFAGSKTVNVFFRTLPQPKIDAAVRGSAHLSRVLDEWNRVAPFQLVRTDDINAANIIVYFSDMSDGSDNQFTDGPGGALANTADPDHPDAVSSGLADDVPANVNKLVRRCICFDLSDTWTIDGAPTANGAKAFGFFSVLLHELGHAFGLPHSQNPTSVMSPYYDGLTQLTADDENSLRQLYAADYS